MGKKQNTETIDHTAVYKARLAEARTKLMVLGSQLEATATLATDLIVIRQTRLVIDDCKRRLAGA